MSSKCFGAVSPRMVCDMAKQGRENHSPQMLLAALVIAKPSPFNPLQHLTVKGRIFLSIAPIRLAWRQTSSHKADFLELGQRTAAQVSTHSRRGARGCCEPLIRKGVHFHFNCGDDGCARYRYPHGPQLQRNEPALWAAVVVAQARGLEFDFLHAVFHHVADRHDAEQTNLPLRPVGAETWRASSAP